MKLQLLSDLHTEFAPYTITNAGADVLILSGDICVANFFNRGVESPKRAVADQTIKMFEHAAKQFKYVIYVAGNHEHYHGRFDDTILTLKRVLGHLSNVIILDNDMFEYDGVRFIGTTLWTDFNRDSFSAKLAVQNNLNDYHCVQRHARGTYRKLKPEDTYFYHLEARRKIDEATKDWPNCVVVGHHAPSYQSIAEQYRSSGLINYGYYSDLEKFIDERPTIRLWTHGHCHNSSDYYIGETRVIANPRGYASINNPIPENENFNPNLIITV